MSTTPQVMLELFTATKVMKWYILEEILTMIATELSVIDVMLSLGNQGDLCIVGPAKLISAGIVIDLD